MVFDIGGKGDKSFNDSAYRGLERAEEELGIAFTEFEPGQDADREQGLRKLANAGYDLVIGVGFLFTDAITNVAREFENTKFACVDYDVSTDANIPSNLAALKFREEEGSFLVGAIAAVTTETGKIGFVGGMDIPLIHKFEAGYTAGAKAIDPDIEVFTSYAGVTPQAFADPVKGKELAMVQFGRRVDVIFHASGTTGNGVIEAAREENAKLVGDGLRRYVIGVDSNQNYLAPGTMLTSMVKSVDNAVYSTVKECIERDFRGGIREYGLAENGVSYAVDEHNEHLITPAIIARVEELKTRIISGEIDVPEK